MVHDVSSLAKLGAMPFAQDIIRTLIPHGGNMCLLASVDVVDATRIECSSTSQQDVTNPLRFDGRLSVSSGIEYAAQAMALHGRLSAMLGNDVSLEKPVKGYIVVLSKVVFHEDYLDQFACLHVECEQLMSLAAGSQYQFKLSAAGACLLEGQALVSLDEESAANESNV